MSDAPWRRPTLRALVPSILTQIGPLLLVVLALALGRGKGFSQSDIWPLAGVTILAVSLVWGWLFTRWRITDEVVEVRRGLFSRRHLTIARDRVRTVDTTASLLKRLVKVVDVKIGTGVEDEQIDLQGLDERDVTQLRAELLRPRSRIGTPAATGGPASPTGSTEVPVERPAELLARFSRSWLRLAPFTPYGFFAIFIIFGFVNQVTDQLGLIDEGWRLDEVLASLTLVAVIAAVLLVSSLALSFIAYAVYWWNLRLDRRGAHLHLEHGLFSTHTVTVEERRVLGLRVAEPPLQRPVHGAHVAALATGTGATRSVQLLPAVPFAVARDVAVHVLRDAGPVDIPLRPPVRAARTRRYTRGQWLTVVLVLGLAVPAWILDWPWWIPVLGLAVAPFGLVVAHYRARHLGHALTGDHLVIGPPQVSRQRVVLRRDGVIGWVLRETWFQRRAGLATLVATTAVGERAYAIVDLPRADAIALAAEVTPVALRGLVTPS